MSLIERVLGHFLGGNVMQQWWMIRAGDFNELIPVWKEEGIASIGWPQLGNPKHYRTKEDMLKKQMKYIKNTNQVLEEVGLVKFGDLVLRLKKAIELLLILRN